MGIPFCKYQGFPNLSPATSQIGNSLFKTTVLSVEYCCPDGPFKKYYLDMFSLVIVGLYPEEFNQLISKKTRHLNYVQGFF